MAQQIQLRRGTASQWTSVNPVLAQGEPGVETDTGKFKIGDGSSAWTALAYVSAPDATTGSKGMVQIAGDLAGTAAAPTVPGLANKVDTTRQITAGTGLTGGGSLAADRTLAVTYGTASGTAAQGNDSRLTGALQATSNLSELASAATARTNLGLGTSATLPSSAVAQTANNLSDLASSATARGNLGATQETVRTAVKTASYTAAAGDLIPVDTTSGNVTITLPTAPADKARVAVKHIIQGGTNTVTIACGGSDVLNKTGGNTSATLTLVNQGATYEYQASTHIWTVTGSDLPLSALTSTFARVAPDWAPGQSVKAGELRVYGGTLYRRIADGTTGTTFTASSWTQVNALGAPSAAAFTLGPGSMSVLSGTPTTGTLASWPTYILADAGTSGISATPGLTPGVEYDVFLRWAPSAAFGVFILGFGSEAAPAEGSAITADPASRFMALAAGSTANVVYRTQLNETVYVAPGGGATAFLRIDRRGADGLDTNTGTLQILGLEFIPRLPIADAPVTDAGTLTLSTWNTPYNGNTVWRGFGIFTPIWSTATAVYVTEAVTIAGVQQSRLAKLDKTTKAGIQDVQLLAETHDASSIGHRWGSVAVDSAGTVVAHPEHHHLPWAGKHSTAAEDLTTLTSTTTPTGSDTNCSYRRFFRNPYNGDLWLGMRANSYNAGLYKWNPGSSVWTQIRSDYFTTPGQYGMEIAFGAASTVYVLTEWYGFGQASYSGYPRRGVAVVKSTDGGTSWTTISGAPLAQPTGGMKDGSEGRMAFPSPKGLYTVCSSRLAVAADGNPVVVASYHHQSDGYRSLWAAKWNPATKDWDRRRLLANNGSNATGNPGLIYTQAGRIIVSAAASDDHTSNDTSTGGSEIAPTPQNLYLFVTDDAATWTRYTVGSTQVGIGGAYLDSEGYRLDGKVRMLPVVEDVPTTSQVWEVTLPA